MTKRIFRSMVVSALLAALLAAALIMSVLFGTYKADMTGELRSEAGAIGYALERAQDEVAYFDGYASRNRVTLIAPDGCVLFDSTTDASRMDNHLSRPEVESALSLGWGEAERYSDTLSETTYYYALRTENGNVLRVASTRSSILGVMLDALPVLGMVLAMTMLFSLVLARLEAQRIVAPLNALDLKKPLENKVYDEITPLLERMDHQTKARDEARRNLTTIMDNMREGMVLLDYQGGILAMNQSAGEVLGVSAGELLGRDMLSACHDSAVGDAVYAALTGRSVILPMEKNGRHYRLLADPVTADGRVGGAVLLALDVTEHHAAERSRREFTANVSHELKTPLTSISGYAEIIRDGVADAEDIQNFAGRIHSEAARLITLINDIIALSRLDEKQGLGEREKVSLTDAAREAASRLEDIARKKGVMLSVCGEGAQVDGYRTLLGEMLFNLIDNAVKYTPEGGRVDVRLDGRVVAVRDTGIGIPENHQVRIFERFYRVDKSHSRMTGGTGLGLSIVKHGAEIHGADVRLESREGEGTCVTIRFPA